MCPARALVLLLVLLVLLALLVLLMLPMLSMLLVMLLVLLLVLLVFPAKRHKPCSIFPPGSHGASELEAHGVISRAR